MSQSLKPGENTSLDHTQGQVTVSHRADAQLDVNLTAFLVTDSGKVVDDSGMVFFNAPEHVSGAANFVAPSSEGGVVSHRIRFDLSRLPAGISKIAITLTQDGSSAGFAQVAELQAQISAGGQSLALAPGAFSAETGIIVAELYVRNGQAKARSVWQGFASGLAGLCDLYGVDVEESAPEPTFEAPAPVLAPLPVNIAKSLITLDKPGVTHKVSLDKGPGAPRSIRVSATWIDNGDGDDNDDLDLRVGILRPDGQMSLIHAPARRGAFDLDPFVFHTGDVVSASASAPGTETVEINPQISRQLGGKVALVCSVYSAVDNGDVSVGSLKPKMRMEYGDQVVECAYEFELEQKVQKGFFGRKTTVSTYPDSYTYVIGLIEIDDQQIILSPSGVTAEPGSEATPWLSWSNGRVALSMDGPEVFKDEPIDPDQDKQYV